MKKKLLIVSLLFSVFLSAQTETKKFSIKEAVEYGLKNNLNLSKTEIDKKIIEAQIAEIKGKALPQINANSRFTDNYSLAEQQLPAEIVGGTPGTTVGVKFGNRYSLTGGIDVQQKLFDFNFFTSVKSVKALRGLQELKTLQTKEDLIINIIQVYIQIQVNNKQIELLQNNSNRNQNLIKLSGLKYNEGFLKKLDLNQLIVNQNNLLTQVDDAKYANQEKTRVLKILLNFPLENEIELSEKLEDKSDFAIQENLSIGNNLEYKQVEKQIELAKIDEKLVKSEYLPQLNAFFNYNYQGNGNEFKFSGTGYNEQRNGTWGITASMPIFDGFQKRKRLQQKQLQTEIYNQDKVILVQNINKEYIDAKEQMALSDTQIKNQLANMKLATENYDGINLSYKEGVAAITELLNSEFALREAQSNYINALLQYRVSELQLIKSSGQLSKLISSN